MNNLLNDKEYLESQLKKDIINEDGCWVWNGQFQASSPVISIPNPGGRAEYKTAHSVARYLKNGKWDSERTYSLCGTGDCVNPDHRTLVGDRVSQETREEIRKKYWEYKNAKDQLDKTKQWSPKRLAQEYSLTQNRILNIIRTQG